MYIRPVVARQNGLRNRPGFRAEGSGGSNELLARANRKENTLVKRSERVTRESKSSAENDIAQAISQWASQLAWLRIQG